MSSFYMGDRFLCDFSNYRLANSIHLANSSVSYLYFFFGDCCIGLWIWNIAEKWLSRCFLTALWLWFLDRPGYVVTTSKMLEIFSWETPALWVIMQLLELVVYFLSIQLLNLDQILEIFFNRFHKMCKHSVVFVAIKLLFCEIKWFEIVYLYGFINTIVNLLIPQARPTLEKLCVLFPWWQIRSPCRLILP